MDGSEDSEPFNNHTLSYNSKGEVSLSSVHPKWKTTNKDAYDSSSDLKDILRSEDEDLLTIDNITKTPQNTNRATEEASANTSTNDFTAHKAAEDISEAATLTKEALAEEGTNGETTPLNMTNAENAPKALINDEKRAARSNNPPVQPAVQPLAPNQNTPLQEMILVELGVELDTEEHF